MLVIHHGSRHITCREHVWHPLHAHELIYWHPAKAIALDRQ
jgi:hypothetical protein